MHQACLHQLVWKVKIAKEFKVWRVQIECSGEGVDFRVEVEGAAVNVGCRFRCCTSQAFLSDCRYLVQSLP